MLATPSMQKENLSPFFICWLHNIGTLVRLYPYIVWEARIRYEVGLNLGTIFLWGMWRIIIFVTIRYGDKMETSMLWWYWPPTFDIQVFALAIALVWTWVLVDFSSLYLVSRCFFYRIVFPLNEYTNPNCPLQFVRLYSLGFGLSHLSMNLHFILRACFWKIEVKNSKVKL